MRIANYVDVQDGGNNSRHHNVFVRANTCAKLLASGNPCLEDPSPVRKYKS